MGLVTRGMEENDKLSINLNDQNFEFNLFGLDVNLDVKSTILLREAIERNSNISCTYKNDHELFKIGDFITNDDVLWQKAIDELLNYEFIRKENNQYIVTSRGLEYYNDNY